MFTWADQVSTDQRVFFDVPADAVKELLDLAADVFGLETIAAAVAERLDGGASGRTWEAWLAEGFSEFDIRAAAGTAAKEGATGRDRKGWFKRTDLGAEMGAIVADVLPAIPQTDLAVKLYSLGEWAHDR